MFSPGSSPLSYIMCQQRSTFLESPTLSGPSPPHAVDFSSPQALTSRLTNATEKHKAFPATTALAKIWAKSVSWTRSWHPMHHWVGSEWMDEHTHQRATWKSVPARVTELCLTSSPGYLGQRWWKKRSKTYVILCAPWCTQVWKAFCTDGSAQPGTSRQASRDIPPEPPGASSLLSRPPSPFPHLSTPAPAEKHSPRSTVHQNRKPFWK